MLEYISWKLDRENILTKLKEEDSKKNALDFQKLFLNSDINSNVSSNHEVRALKLMLGEVKRSVTTTNRDTRVRFTFIEFSQSG